AVEDGPAALPPAREGRHLWTVGDVVDAVVVSRPICVGAVHPHDVAARAAAAGVDGQEGVLQRRDPDLLQHAVGQAVHVPEQVRVLVVVVGGEVPGELLVPGDVGDAHVHEAGRGGDGD